MKNVVVQVKRIGVNVVNLDRQAGKISPERQSAIDPEKARCF